ncbi:hypothetical protein DV515_00016775 [Chloebia gouldiae]|uniref:Uncharacterized protein n=1 Tax=Chloebia gouldiae TaxID=44316 RepID=A0A3L8RB53_CHLGU|nr:hypothetical protein DV515_00016775 [Chloebia gouldiae]
MRGYAHAGWGKARAGQPSGLQGADSGKAGASEIGKRERQGVFTLENEQAENSVKLTMRGRLPGKVMGKDLSVFSFKWLYFKITMKKFDEEIWKSATLTRVNSFSNEGIEKFCDPLLPSVHGVSSLQKVVNTPTWQERKV